MSSSLILGDIMEETHYPIMDKPYTELLLEELVDETVPFAKAAVSTFYKAKGELFAHTIGTYQNARFTKRIERFAEQEKLLSPKQIKNFYENIDESKLNILFELFEKARTSTYDLHAKILAKLYGVYLNKGEFNYHEKTFLANISILNDEDLLKFYNLLAAFFKEKGTNIDIVVMKKEKLIFKTETYTDLYIYEKLIRVGLIVNHDNSRGMNFYQPSGNVSEIFGMKQFYIHNFSKDIYLLMKEILGD